jgi:hypothetical protein
MGYNSLVLIHNDYMHQLSHSAEAFVDKLQLKLSGGFNYESKNQVCQGVYVVHCDHMDTHKAYMVGSNDCVGIPGGLMHVGRTSDSNEELNLKMLKLMADAAGYRLVKKSK